MFTVEHYSIGYVAAVAQCVESQSKSRADDWGRVFKCRSKQKFISENKHECNNSGL